MDTDTSFLEGDVVWIDLSPVVGREQNGRRPAVVVSAADYNELVDTMLFVVPLTTVNRGWPNHVRVFGPTGLSRDSWALTEQMRAVSRERVSAVAGAVDDKVLAAIREWIAVFLGMGDEPKP
ncbi:type II toxin-antitoxin system PemK/MazF family toxin [Actinomyces glycerinitolerans]|uniref:mRNA interferase n=1 Tax=Actinomyces glycerinitolerans TaxID=1892869 RepID=A0A1M4S0V3_9ACTO|nr:type II toxin-antitoxin system PemK/MazF family toxin [Actinomyces glycerinitolerans]SHE25865.1 plasmid maintenance toxin/cell growth inhibitor [Actinomyces glycerinitolerans]